MKTNIKLALLGAMTALALPMAAQAQWWAQHPGYVRALSDLRSAYWLIQHRAADDPAQANEEGHALGEIRAAYGELQQASVADGKNIEDRPPPDFAWGDHGGRLHRAMDLLKRAHDEIGSEEDNPAARGLRDRANFHIDAAARQTAAALQYWHF